MSEMLIIGGTNDGRRMEVDAEVVMRGHLELYERTKTEIPLLGGEVAAVGEIGTEIYRYIRIKGGGEIWLEHRIPENQLSKILLEGYRRPKDD